MMDAANIGSAKASMRRIAAPSSRTSASGVIHAMTAGAERNIIAPMTPMIAMPEKTVICAKRFAKFFRAAPRLCPISVVAASAMP